MIIPSLTPQEAAVTVAMVFACYTDLSQWKIPNALTGLLLLVGFGLNLFFGLTSAGTGVILGSLLGFAVAFGVHYGLWILGVQKGGDAKLMIAVGASVGWQLMLETTLWKLVLLIPVGLVVLWSTGNLTRLRAAFAHVRAKAQGQPSEEPPRLTYMPFAPVITLGWFCAILTDWFEVWIR